MKEQDNAEQEEEAEYVRNQETTLRTTLGRWNKRPSGKPEETKRVSWLFPRRALAAPAKSPWGTEPKRTTEEARESGTRQQGYAERGRKETTLKETTTKRAVISRGFAAQGKYTHDPTEASLGVKPQTLSP